MKLRTKFQDEDFELGEVVDADVATMPDGRIKLQAEAMVGGLHTFFYDRLEKFYSEWEDAPEEPKEYWYASCDGRALKATTDEDDYNEKHNSGHKSIGNYFESEEEAKQAVKKLKAFRRLTDKGFRFRGWDTSHHNLGVAEFFLPDVVNDVDDYRQNLDLLFGGEE